eukprot:5016849-Prorocentrum_lima.AAC.1
MVEKSSCKLGSGSGTCWAGHMLLAAASGWGKECVVTCTCTQRGNRKQSIPCSFACADVMSSLLYEDTAE